MRPSQFNGLFRLRAGDQAVEQPGGKSISSSNPVEDIQLGSWSAVGLAIGRLMFAPLS
jgi:hypothetical protein